MGARRYRWGARRRHSRSVSGDSQGNTVGVEGHLTGHVNGFRTIVGLSVLNVEFLGELSCRGSILPESIDRVSEIVIAICVGDVRGSRHHSGEGVAAVPAPWFEAGDPVGVFKVERQVSEMGNDAWVCF